MFAKNSPFQSFWMAGFECSDQLNAFGNRVDLMEETDHLNQIESDFARLAEYGFRVVREGIRWSRVERTPYRYDWRDVGRIMEAADRNGLQVVWDMCHFGYPDDLTPLHPMFARRFAHLCEAFATFYASRYPGVDPVIVPINEVGFISWLGGEVRGTTPYCINQGWEVKYHLMKAFIEGAERIKQVLPGARIMMVEPLVNITTGSQDPAVIEAARHQCENQFQTVDILTGRICPELRGRPEYLDIMGLNYYFNNQWDFESNRLLDWHPAACEPLRKSLCQMLSEVHERYGVPIALTETSHPKEDRPIWMEMIGREVQNLEMSDLPFLGVCIYPIIDRPDWDYPGMWHHSGLWDNTVMTLPPVRVIDEPYAEAMRFWLSRVPGPQAANADSSSGAVEDKAMPVRKDSRVPRRGRSIRASGSPRRTSELRCGPGARHGARSLRPPLGKRTLAHFRNLQEMRADRLQAQRFPGIADTSSDHAPDRPAEEMERVGTISGS